MQKILCLTTYPPRECGIATFADDLLRAIDNKFGRSYAIEVCAVESATEQHTYPEIVKHKLNTSVADDYGRMAQVINDDAGIALVLVQHEFGLHAEHPDAFLQMLQTLTKPSVVVFHTVLSPSGKGAQQYLQAVAAACDAVVVMTQTSAQILQKEYGIDAARITIIPHGTHLVLHSDKKKLKDKYQVAGRRVLCTFGLLSPGKSIETTLDALPEIVEKNPNVIFLIIGKTHPSVLKTEGESYREMLQEKVRRLGLSDAVRFVNLYLDLPILLEYLQLTDVYLFTSSDPNQAVSGTFVYALSCGCPIVATPIPHALELLKDKSGIIFDFKNYAQLAQATNRLLSNENLRSKMRITGLQKTASTAWENAAIAFAILFGEKLGNPEPLSYTLPPINTGHIKRMSHNFAMIQFSRGNRPDIKTGYTLDDNARALMALCNVYVDNKDVSCEKYIKTYLNFIRYCLQPNGAFLNYVCKDLIFTTQNQEVGLADSNGRAICALGYFISYGGKFPDIWTLDAIDVFRKTFGTMAQMQSPRSIAFSIKGLCYYFHKYPAPEIHALIVELADKLVAAYRANSESDWAWYESGLTYDNSALPESLLLAYLATGNTHYKEIAKTSFDFLLEKVFCGRQIKVISNQGWMQKENAGGSFGEQPVDVAGTVIALRLFYDVFKQEDYLERQRIAFNWFLGANHLHQIVYNPATGGCYDGLEEHNVNLNQGAESTVCYLMARSAMEKTKK